MWIKYQYFEPETETLNFDLKMRSNTVHFDTLARTKIIVREALFLLIHSCPIDRYPFARLRLMQDCSTGIYSVFLIYLSNRFSFFLLQIKKNDNDLFRVILNTKYVIYCLQIDPHVLQNMSFTVTVALNDSLTIIRWQRVADKYCWLVCNSSWPSKHSTVICNGLPPDDENSISWDYSCFGKECCLL